MNRVTIASTLAATALIGSAVAAHAFPCGAPVDNNPPCPATPKPTVTATRTPAPRACPPDYPVLQCAPHFPVPTPTPQQGRSPSRGVVITPAQEDEATTTPTPPALHRTAPAPTQAPEAPSLIFIPLPQGGFVPPSQVKLPEAGN